MSEPVFVGINQAARLTGKNKATISRDTKSGKLSAGVGDNGAKRYQVVELERVYGTLRVPDAVETETRKTPELSSTAVVMAPEIVKAKDEVIALLKDQVEDLRRERDHWREQAVRCLPSPAEPKALVSSERKGIWPFRKRVLA